MPSSKITGRVSVRRLTYGKRFAPSGLGLHKNVFGLRPLHVFVTPHFFVRWNCFAIPLSRTKKRRLPVHVVRHTPKIFGKDENIDKNICF